MVIFKASLPETALSRERGSGAPLMDGGSAVTGLKMSAASRRTLGALVKFHNMFIVAATVP